MYGTGDGCSAYGNRNFWRYYTDWFGSTKYVNPVIDFKGAICNNPSTPFFSLRAGKVQIASSGYWLTFENNTGSGCIEFHRWEPSGNFSIWSHHLSTNHPAIDPANGEVVFADRNGDGKDEANLILYKNTGSGKIEVHTWSQDFSDWTYHGATNHPAIDPANGEVVFADRNGDGKDEANLILYKNTGSGKIEVHTWSQDFSDWTYHGATNHPAI